MSQKTIILFQSRAGTTEKVSKMIADKLGSETEVVNLKKNKKPDLGAYDNVIIGGSIRASFIQKGIKKYIDKHRDELLSKRLGLFLCCMQEGETAQKQFDESYPADIREKAAAHGLLGGEFDFDRLNSLEKSIIKKVAGVTEPVFNIKADAIDKFVADFTK